MENFVVEWNEENFLKTYKGTEKFVTDEGREYYLLFLDLLKDEELLSHIKFVNDVKNGIVAKAPVYSHKVYDIIPDEFDVIDRPDILIVEGINVLQLPSHEPIFVSDFFDFSLYVDAKEEYIKRWYLERFGMLLDTAFKDPTNYYYPYAIGDRTAAFKMASKVWEDVNHPNLHEYILPTRNRADLIIVKSANHLLRL